MPPGVMQRVSVQHSASDAVEPQNGPHCTPIGSIMDRIGLQIFRFSYPGYPRIRPVPTRRIHQSRQEWRSWLPAKCVLIRANFLVLRPQKTDATDEMVESLTSRNSAMSGFSVASRRNGVGPFNSLRSCWSAIAVMATAFLLAGCQTAELSQRRSTVSADVSSRFGSNLSEESEAGTVQLPPGVATDDGLTEDEAVAISLWNNAAYQALLADLGISSAQLFDAGLIADPQFQIFFPLGPKQLEFTTFQAVDALWLQPVREKAAELDLDRVSQSMVQNGLDVIRDARVAHASLLLAQEQAAVAREAESLRTQIAALAQKRLDAGDISELEATTSRIDALQARATAGRAAQDVELARQQLRTLLGLAMHGDSLNAIADADTLSLPQNAESLVSTALAMRPDLRAAELAIEAECERAGLAENQFMNLDAVYDANGSGSRGFESGAGLRFTIPIF
ncbi:MAG: cobalt-zinc-cadmium efflux system outer membrane protein, partial [Planctomycetaceae bacterium]